MKILICDDSSFVRAKLSEFLVDHGHEIIEASNGKECIKRNKRHQPDLLIIDIVMPVLDGLTAMQEILKDKPAAKVIILTNMGQQTKIIEALQKGATDYLIKPFDPGKLLAAIEKIRAT